MLLANRVMPLQLMEKGAASMKRPLRLLEKLVVAASRGRRLGTVVGRGQACSAQNFAGAGCMGHQSHTNLSKMEKTAQIQKRRWRAENAGIGRESRSRALKAALEDTQD